MGPVVTAGRSNDSSNGFCKLTGTAHGVTASIGTHTQTMNNHKGLCDTLHALFEQQPLRG